MQAALLLFALLDLFLNGGQGSPFGLIGNGSLTALRIDRIFLHPIPHSVQNAGFDQGQLCADIIAGVARTKERGSLTGGVRPSNHLPPTFPTDHKAG
ncbi:hypothetical protein SDC9_188435 [bioreactor metagenome]|uniref:Uncharacterized protein n=1 Tax=bioreactor metagenome TaxID=1076179 RepID=A0A645HPB4_9ZZZZ